MWIYFACSHFLHPNNIGSLVGLLWWRALKYSTLIGRMAVKVAMGKFKVVTD